MMEWLLILGKMALIAIPIIVAVMALFVFVVEPRLTPFLQRLFRKEPRP